jgi:hypothetical protein
MYIEDGLARSFISRGTAICLEEETVQEDSGTDEIVVHAEWEIRAMNRRQLFKYCSQHGIPVDFKLTRDQAMEKALEVFRSDG